MLSEKLKSDILAARDGRWQTLEALKALYPGMSLITLAANAAGENKDRPELRALLHYAEKKLSHAAFTAGCYSDAAGYIIFMKSDIEPVMLKKLAVGIEEEFHFCRLLDIDVYDRELSACDRAALGMKNRKCLLCNGDAADCIRGKKHDYRDIISRTDLLLDQFKEHEQSTL